MDYRFEISKPDSTDFRCEIAINGEQTFQQLHDKIVETLNFDGSQMASFFTLDKMGNRGKEIALMEMSIEDEEDNNTLVMDVTTIREIVNASCIELEYVYDFFANNYLKVEYAGEYIGDSADVLPLCVYCGGNCLVKPSTMQMMSGVWIKMRIMMTVLWKNSEEPADEAVGGEGMRMILDLVRMKRMDTGTIMEMDMRMILGEGMMSGMKVWMIILINCKEKRSNRA